MAHAVFKVRRVLGLSRDRIQRHSGKLIPLSKILKQASSHISHSNLKPNLSHRTFLEDQLGAFNLPCHVNNSCDSQALLFSGIAKTIRRVSSVSSSSSQEGMTKIPVTRELISSYRTAYDNGLRRLYGPRRILSTHSLVKHEVSSLMRSCRGDICGWRAYHVDSSGVQHFKRRGPTSWSEKIVTQRSMGMILVLMGSGLVIYVTNQQTIPYTHRKHLMLVSPKLERSIGDQSFDMLMKEYKTRILPANHPQSVRVHNVADQIITALMLGVKASDWGQLDNGGQDIMDLSKEWDVNPHGRKSERPLLEPYDSHTHTHDDSLDEAWVDKSRREGLRTGQEGYTQHLEGMKWKVVVVDDAIVNAICIPGGKIVVFTGLLNKFRSDTEVATVVAHEIGHAVARHSAESLTRNLFIVALELIVLSVFYVPGLVNSVSELLLRLPFSRRMEIEADHIGLILMAAAGYDPRLAPAFYEKLGTIDNAPEYAQYMSTHPSGKKRGEMLRNTLTMEEAMRIYQQKMSGQGTEGFF